MEKIPTKGCLVVMGEVAHLYGCLHPQLCGGVCILTLRPQPAGLLPVDGRTQTRAEPRRQPPLSMAKVLMILTDV